MSAAAAPRVISAFPAQREVVGPESVIQIVFDQSMNRASVEAAFIFEPAANGALTWTDDSTLTFRPAGPLARGGEYRVSLTTDAQSAAGVPLEEPFRLVFQVTPNLSVSQVIPAPGAQDVEAGATLTVVFDRPVVPLVTTGEQPGLPQPLTLSPAVEGKGEWVGTAIYLFRPAKALAGGTLYTATVNGDLKDVDGSPLQAPYTWQFRTIAPQVLDFQPRSGQEQVGLEAQVTIRFNQPMDRTSARQAFTLRNVATGANVAGTVTFESDDSILIFKPASRLELDTGYQASILASARSASGEATLTNPQAVIFRTVPYPRVVETYPRSGERVAPGSGARIMFSAPLDRESFGGRVHVEPQPEGLAIFPGGSYLNINFRSLPNTTYTITLDAGVTDLYGNAIKEPYRFSFSTENLPPGLGLARREAIAITSAYRPHTLMLAAGVNISAVEVRLTALELPEFLAIPDRYGYLQLHGYSPPRITREWTQRVEADPNQRVEIPILLAGEQGGQLTPGVYYLDIFAPEFRRFLLPPWQDPIQQILVVANASLTAKQTAEGNLLVWVTDLKTGQPVASTQIHVYDNARRVVASGMTDGDGLLRVKLPTPLWDQRTGYWLVATGNGVFSLSNTQWTTNLEPYRFEAYYDFQPRKTQVYLYTDQPIYRPGRPVYFRGIVRDQDDVTFAVPAGEQVQVIINDAQGQEIYKEMLTLNVHGAFSGKIDLAPQGEAPLGGYGIQVLFRNQYHYLSFQVAEFRPPEFLVNAAPEAAQVAAGDLIKVTVDARFLFGGPVSGGMVNWVAVADQGYFNYLGEGNYDFTGSRGYVYGRQVANGTGTLDEKGQLQIEVPADLGGVATTQVFTIEASVTDISNQTIAGRTTVTVHPATVYVGLRPAKYVGKAGEPLDVNVIVVDWASQPQAGQAVNLRAAERRWEQDPNTLEWSQKSIPVSEETLRTDDRGRAIFTFTPPRAGIYEIEATTRDPRERQAVSLTTVWVQGKESVTWNRDDKSITLVADKKGQYEPGETASVLIASPFPEPVSALITVERADIMKTEIVEITGSYTYNLPIEALHAPNVYVAVAIMRGSGEGTEDNSIVPDLRYGLINLEVKVQQQLKIKITPSAERAEPGATVRFDVLITDLDDRPVVAEIGLSLSDVATLSVGAPNSGPIFSTFWAVRGLSVVTSSPLSKLIDDLLPKDVQLQAVEGRTLALMGTPSPSATAAAGMVAPAPPGAAREEPEALADRDGRDTAQQPIPRTDFVDTPLWRPDVVSGPDGRAEVSVRLPDNLTTWRLDARAISSETYVGDATLEIISTKPLLVRPATPRFFVVGDETELAMVVNNNTETDLAVNVALEAKGVTLRADARQTVNIPKDGRVRVTWLATVEDVEHVDLTFSAISGEYSDASKPAVGLGDARLLPVFKYLAPDYVATAGVLRQPGERTEGIIVPSVELAPSGELTVRLNPSLAATTLDGLRYLRNFPYQCLEQTVSRFLPNVITFRALQRLGLDKPELRAELDAAVQYALNRLKLEQKPDGGWGWYPGDESNLLTTSYALLGLVEARDTDFPIEPEMINRALAFIFSKLSPISDATPAYELNRRAFVLYVLARAGNTNIEQLEAVFRRREKMNLYARALLAQAYDLSRDALGFQDRIDTLLSDLQTAAIVSATGIHWEESYRDWWNWGSDTRSTAIVLGTLVRFMPESDLIPNIVRWLMIARRGDAWETTQETAWAVMALTDWMVASGELKADYAYNVSLNGNIIGEGQANAETLRDTQTLKVVVGDMLREQINRLTFRHEEGPGALYYTAALHVNQPVEAIQPTNRGLSLSRTYYLDDKPVTSARVGDVITVALEIALTNDLYYVVINDPIPAGTEPIDRSLQTTGQIGQRPALDRLDTRRYGWGWWWFSDTQLRTEKVVLSAQYLPRGTYRFVYQVQATTPGTYRVIPPHGNEFYFPEVFGRGAGSLFTVMP